MTNSDNNSNYNILVCPVCTSKLIFSKDIVCEECNRNFQFLDGIPLLYYPTEESTLDNVTDVVKDFYEEHPFPNYDEVDTAERLIEKAKQGVFARLLDSQILPDASVLEVGCGTGQLSNFLAVDGRTVYGTDLCINSLQLGYKFSVEQAIDSVTFLQMNLFRPVFREESFDFVLCNGVLHHTNDPFGGFCSISRLVRPGGYIVIGLYNKIGRVWTNLRRQFFRLTGDRFHFLDRRMAESDISDKRKQIWFADQYLHPHEESHTIDEVLNWFDKTGFEFINGIPKITPFSNFSHFEALFEPNPRGSRLGHILTQILLALKGGPEGGFFIMIARKK